jgi:hypothetical protein
MITLRTTLVARNLACLLWSLRLVGAIADALAVSPSMTVCSAGELAFFALPAQSAHATLRNHPTRDKALILLPVVLGCDTGGVGEHQSQHKERYNQNR